MLMIEKIEPLVGHTALSQLLKVLTVRSSDSANICQAQRTSRRLRVDATSEGRGLAEVRAATDMCGRAEYEAEAEARELPITDAEVHGMVAGWNAGAAGLDGVGWLESLTVTQMS